MNAKKGQMKHGFAFAGSNAYRADKVTSVKEVMDSMLQEYEDSAKQ